jgi:tRNA (mo5U34)-methyltransferase
MSRLPLPHAPSAVKVEEGLIVEGFVDDVDAEKVVGWAWAPSHPERRLGLTIRVDDGVVGRIAASLYRSDVHEAGKGDGGHGFCFKFNNGERPEPGSIVSVTVGDDGPPLTGSPRTLPTPCEPERQHDPAVPTSGSPEAPDATSHSRRHPGYVPLGRALHRDDAPSPQPTEYLLPQIRKHIEPEEFPYVGPGKSNVAWESDALRETLHQLGPWEYYFEFAHGLTTRISSTFNDQTILFHRYRSKLITETIVELLGESLSKTEVIDLACHCGAFSLDIASRGAAKVTGIELREQNLRQAAFLRDYYEVQNVTYQQGDVTSLEMSLQADVVMCLGLLYHVVDPVGLLEQCARMTRHILVVDTITHKEPLAAFHLIRGKNTNTAIEGTRPSELHPTYRAVIALLEETGFKEIVEVVGTCSEPVELYSNQYRRCLIGIK